MVVRSEEGMEGGMEEDEEENIPLVQQIRHLSSVFVKENSAVFVLVGTHVIMWARRLLNVLMLRKEEPEVQVDAYKYSLQTKTLSDNHSSLERSTSVTLLGNMDHDRSGEFEDEDPDENDDEAQDDEDEGSEDEQQAKRDNRQNA
ncbi:hypothetical protein B0H14DRAFT_2589851 [Mycena olivaceomarginata]|nr:hypothetical protein B0H14DRAFT_2589851 [Mycena olivaceomarginata]